MPPPIRPHDVEERFRRLLDDHHLPAPDRVEHRPGEVVFLYDDRRLAVVVEFESGPLAGDGRCA